MVRIIVVKTRQPWHFDVRGCHMGTAVKRPVPDRVKQSFVIFDIRALWRTLTLRAERQSAPMSKITNDGLTPSGWHSMLYSCTYMATVDVKGYTINLVRSVTI